MRNLLLAIKLLYREWRGGEFRILLFAVIIAITAITGLNFYTDRLKQALDEQAAAFLGGDLVISSPRPVLNSWQQQAQALNLKTAQVWLFPTMALANGRMQLVNLQAVSSNYPLVGTLHSIAPAKGTVWVDGRLLPLLHMKLNQNITIGTAQFVLSRILDNSLNMYANGFEIAPRLVMNLADVPQTQTVLPGSRVDYRLVIAGKLSAIQQFHSWISPQLQPSDKLFDSHTNQLTLQDTLVRAENYLQLASLICLILAGIAIASSAQHFSRRHQMQVALLRCFGATKQQVQQLYFIQLLLLALIGGTIGVLLGYIAQYGFAYVFQQWFGMLLPQSSAYPILIGFSASILILLGFALPAIWPLPDLPAWRILRQEIIGTFSEKTSIYYLTMGALILLMFLLTHQWLLILLLLNALIITVSILFAVVILLFRVLKPTVTKMQGVFRHALLSMIRHVDIITTQIVCFGLVIMVILLLAIVRTDLFTTWQQQLPAKTPNYFAFNIDPTEAKDFQQYLIANQINPAGIYPMVRGRLILLNNQPIKAAVPKSARNNNALNRELNLTWAATLPSDNKIIYGQWWGSNFYGKNLVSIEERLANDLQIKLGDQLTFQIGDQQITATVASIRSLYWGSFHPNFYMIFPPGVLDNLPSTYITSFYLPMNKNFVLNNLQQRYPSVTIIDVENILNQIKNIISKTTLGIQYLLVFALLAAIAVLYASLQSTIDERLYENAMLRVFGVDRKFIQNSLIIEFVILGILAGLIGAVSASGISYLLAKNVFNIHYQFNYRWCIFGIIFGVIAITLPGLWLMQRVVRVSPLQIFREV